MLNLFPSRWSSLRDRGSRRRGGLKRRRHEFRVAALELFETRVVPAVVLMDPFVSAQYLELVSGPDIGGADTYNPEACWTVQISASGAANLAALEASTGDTYQIQVSVASYVEISNYPAVEEQEFLGAETTFLSLAAPGPVTLCAPIDRVTCTQVDIYTGPPVEQFTAGGNVGGLGTKFMDGVLLHGMTEVDPSNADEVCAPRGDCGLSPGYYKNHTDGYENVKLGDVFTALGASSDPAVQALATKTFDEALSFSGGPTYADKVEILLRQAVAAYLNAVLFATDSDPNTNYPLYESEVRMQTDAAILSGSQTTVLNLKTTFDGYNNLGCCTDDKSDNGCDKDWSAKYSSGKDWSMNYLSGKDWSSESSGGKKNWKN